MARKVLALSGGSVRGAFQAGAIKAVFDRGWTPDVIYGVSVGSLNGAYIVQHIGGQAPATRDFKAAAQGLWDFWVTRVTKRQDLATKRMFNIFSNKRHGLYRTRPLEEKIREILSVNVMNQAALPIYVGVVNPESGTYSEHGLGDPDFLDFVWASTAIPVVMESVYIHDIEYVDGGMRHVAPLSSAFKDPATTEIVCIACDPELIPPSQANISLDKHVMRMADIFVNERLNSDIQLANTINALCKAGQPTPGYRYVPLFVVRPVDGHPPLIELKSFDTAAVKAALELGYNVGMAAALP